MLHVFSHDDSEIGVVREETGLPLGLSGVEVLGSTKVILYALSNRSFNANSDLKASQVGARVDSTKHEEFWCIDCAINDDGLGCSELVRRIISTRDVSDTAYTSAFEDDLGK